MKRRESREAEIDAPLYSLAFLRHLACRRSPKPGCQGYEATGWSGLLAPAGTPRPIIDRLNAEIIRILPLPDVKERLAGDGSEFGKNTPELFAGFIRAELDKWRKVIQTANVKVE